MKQEEKMKLKSDIALNKAVLNVIKDDLKNNRDGRRTKKLEKDAEKLTLSLELRKASLVKKRKEKKISKEKRCMMCGEPTKNVSGFCNTYSGSTFGCKENWMQEYGSLPTKKELNAKWRDDFD